MKVVRIESHYLGSLEYYALLLNCETVEVETAGLFRKQTYRNRCYILSANGVLPLIVPVNYSSKMHMKEVKVDQNQRWKKDHWGAIYSAYGKAPFFDYFAPDFYEVIHKRHQFLIDLNRDFLDLTLKLLQADVKVAYLENDFSAMSGDFLNVIIPKKSYVDRKIYTPVEYTQLFGEEFCPNLSVIDLLMCEGPNSRQILSASFLS